MRRPWLLWTVIAAEYLVLAAPGAWYLYRLHSRPATPCMDWCGLTNLIEGVLVLSWGLLVGVGVLVTSTAAAFELRHRRRGGGRLVPSGPVATATVMSAFGFGIGAFVAALAIYVPYWIFVFSFSRPQL